MQRARKSTDYVLPSEVCVMINVIFSSKSRAAKIAIDSGEVCLSILKWFIEDKIGVFFSHQS